MDKAHKLALTTALGLVLVFIFSCSSGSSGNGDDGGYGNNETSSYPSSSASYNSSSSGGNSPKEVKSVVISTNTLYNTSTGEVSNTIESRQEYEYNSDGSLKQMTGYFNGVKNTLSEYNSSGDVSKLFAYKTDGSVYILQSYEYNSNGDLQRQVTYNTNGNGLVSSDLRFQTTTASINSIKRTTRQIQELYNASGELIGTARVDYDWNSDGSYCTATAYNNAGEITSTRRTTYVTVNSKTLEASVTVIKADGSEISRTENEYNSKGDLVKVIYSADGVKLSEAVYSYTYTML